ncbi:MAG: hypothetical protein KC649_03390, partial [Candidatus Omnitrophica bacterium]|nr:hypothetical protein [Candidatus Omnitrophota bacterium]
MISALILIIGYLLAFGLTALRIFNAVCVNENWIRLHSALIWLKKLPVYYGELSGPIINTIYPPLSFLPYALAGHVQSPHTFIRLAAAVAVCCVYFPVLLWAFFWDKEAAKDRISSGLAFYFFISLGMLFYPIRNAAFNIHADAPMLFFSALAVFLISQERFRSKALFLFLSSAAAVLAVWSKQVAIAVPAAALSYILLTDGVKRSLKYLIFLIICAAAASAFFFKTFSVQNLLFQILVIPEHHPFRADAAEWVWPLLRDILILTPMILIAIWPQLKEPAKSFREWCRVRHWPVLFWTAIFMLPFSVLGGLKEGGSRNTIAYTTYFLLAGIAVAPLGRLQVRTRLQWLAVLCIIVQAAALPYELLLKPAEEDFAKTAESKILADPGEIYFPRLPLLHLWYENRIYHDTIGLRDRVWAGMDPSEKRLLAHIPENAKAIAFYEHDSDDMDLFRGVLTEF